MSLKTKNEIEIVGRERLTPAIEVAKKFVATTGSRPALQHIALMPNGEVQATDSHKAIILKDVHSYSDVVCLNPKTLDLVRGYNFPDISNIASVKKDNVKAEITLDRQSIQSILDALRFFKGRKGLNNPVKILVTKEKITFEQYLTKIEVKNSDGWMINQIVDEEIKISFIPNLLIDCLASFIKFSDSEKITAFYHSSMRPLVFENNEMLMCALPLRTYE